jgi:hypothetical protein
MDIEKTKAYYAEIKREDICACDYCQNLIDEIKQAYPNVAQYLLSLGVNIERPFEALLPIEDSDNGYMDYPIVQYLIVGDSGDFKKTNIGDIEIKISDYHPDADYEGEHFIIDVGAFHIKCRHDKYNFD